jgi:hypothetical protein
MEKAKASALRRRSLAPTWTDAPVSSGAVSYGRVLAPAMEALEASRLTRPATENDDVVIMTRDGIENLEQNVVEFARATEAPEDSFLIRRLSIDDPEQVRSVIDGLTLSLISFCYHRHPRGENVHEIMEELEHARPGSEAARNLELRADDAAALQIPFIVNLNRLLEDYYHLRGSLEAKLLER